MNTVLKREHIVKKNDRVRCSGWGVVCSGQLFLNKASAKSALGAEKWTLPDLDLFLPEILGVQGYTKMYFWCRMASCRGSLSHAYTQEIQLPPASSPPASDLTVLSAYFHSEKS